MNVLVSTANSDHGLSISNFTKCASRVDPSISYRLYFKKNTALGWSVISYGMRERAEWTHDFQFLFVSLEQRGLLLMLLARWFDVL